MPAYIDAPCVLASHDVPPVVHRGDFPDGPSGVGLDGLGAPAELLDLPFGGVQLRHAQAVELLSPLPEGHGVLELGPAALELGDDLLELSARLDRKSVV